MSLALNSGDKINKFSQRFVSQSYAIMTLSAFKEIGDPIEDGHFQGLTRMSNYTLANSFKLAL